ncbi:MAG TPA: 2OG-Fe(II) oxygenase [Pyrinomonadaceae bacterium]|nr:2OG-Fe(II) oxygenase [Pyrinomonadaceae bacterium]
MSQTDILKRLGVVTVRNFLDVATCERIIAEICESKRTPATSYRDGRAQGVDEQKRRVLRASVSSGLHSLVGERLREHKRMLEESFGAPLADWEAPQFLQYRAGDFFIPHTDSSVAEGSRQFIKRRAMSVVIFLNGESDEPAEGRFGGGSLVLYNLLSDPRTERLGFPIKAEPGTFLAFPSHIFHEVTPVKHGARYTVVTWFGRHEGDGVSEPTNGKSERPTAPAQTRDHQPG